MVVMLGVAEAIIVSTFFICFRHILGYAYSNDEQVVAYISEMVPLLCISVSADSLIGALSGEFTLHYIVLMLYINIILITYITKQESLNFVTLCAGIARGGGFQQIGAYVNLGAYYLVGIPMGLLLGFHLHLNAKGLWMGTLSGSVLQVIILAIVTALTDWQKEVCI